MRLFIENFLFGNAFVVSETSVENLHSVRSRQTTGEEGKTRVTGERTVRYEKASLANRTIQLQGLHYF